MHKMKILVILLLLFGCNFISAQLPILDVIANVPNGIEIKIIKKDNSKLLNGTIYNYNSSKLFLNTACLQKRDYITIGVATGSFTGVGYLIALGSSPLTEKYKALSEIKYSNIENIQIKKTNNRNAFIASGLLVIGFLSQANKPEMEGSALAFLWLPISLTPFLLKPYFSYSWETIYLSNAN